MSTLERRNLKSICDIIVSKCFISPLTRLKYLRRKLNVKTIKIALMTAAFSLSIIVLILYHLYHFSFSRNHHESSLIDKKLSTTTERNYDTPMRHIPLDEVYKNVPDFDQDFSIEFEETRQAYMINTQGCRIPVAIVNYQNAQKRKKIRTCGGRAIFLNRDNDTLRVEIKEKSLRQFLRNGSSYHCCYRYFERSIKPGFEHRSLRFSECKKVRHKQTIFLYKNFINVQCFENSVYNKTRQIYNDVYAFSKRSNRINVTRCGEKYNVLVLGMNSMSLPHFVQTMPRTVKFLQKNFWPGFRGYHKVEDDKFYNLMAVLMGLNVSTVREKCSRRMDQCNDNFIWTKFKNAGYITAYGEDYLRFPNLFTKEYMLKKPPTDHYLKPLFLCGENLSNKSHFTDNQVCAGRISSGQQILEYIHDFILTYKNDPYFGFFWINSFSCDMNNYQLDSDRILENFFNRLTYTDAFDNTFIYFLSDEGIQFGGKRLLVESYYDNRMPFLFIWPPRVFKMNYPSKLKSILINQNKLTTAYDIHATLLEISELSRCERIEEFEASVSKHQSLFSVINPNRTCQDVGIHDKWCSCHKLYPIDVQDPEGIRSVHFAVSHVQSVIKNIRTKQCWSCKNLSLKNVSRIHFYYDNDKINIYFVVAFSMTPGNIFYEATVIRKDVNMEVIGSVSIISSYRGFGDCTVDYNDRICCVCQRIKDCRLTSTF